MATQSASDDGLVDVRELVTSIINAYRYMEMQLKRYALFVVVPSLGFSLLVGAAVLVRAPPLFVALPAALLGLLPPLGALIYPKVAADRRRREIKEQFHLFLTHITVLSLTNIERVEVFRTLAEVDEYGALAEEMGRVTALVDTFNQSLDDACRRRSKHVPSELLGDFLERLAYTVGAGQELSDFLVDEQESIIQGFVTQYESDLSKLEVLQELYLSLMLSTTFILVFSTVLPLLLGVPPTLLVGGVIVMFAIVQGSFLFVIHSVAPRDPVWLQPESHHSQMHRVRVPLVIGVVLSLVTAGVVLVVGFGLTPLAPDVLPRPLYLALPTTPLLIPGLAMRREEQKVTDRDSGFPSFIRALGGVEAVKQTSTANVLETLRTKDFGSLTENVDNLFRRLRTRIDTEGAWRLFAAETGSYLIQKFGDMYVVGRRMGGNPRRLGQVISANINELLWVRKQREQAAATFIGIIYGITAASLFSAFIGLEIAGKMLEITAEISKQNGAFVNSLFSTSSYDIDVIEFLLLLVLLLNGIFSSMMIRLIDRGHFVNALPHFVGLVWTGACVAVVTRYVVAGLI